jgi:hypothetical protein
VAHPLIHLGYAYELDSRTIAIEALALGTCFYNFLHKYLDNPSYTKPNAHHSTSLLDILHKVRKDKRFDGIYDHRSGDITKVFEEREEAFLEYWNAWELPNPKGQFEESQKTAVAILMGTEAPEKTKFDFFFVHLLTSSHAIRILLPLIPAKFHVSLVRQWWLFTLAVYIAQTRPEIDLGIIDEYDLKGRGWKFVVDKALNSKNSLDAHFVKSMYSPTSSSLGTNKMQLCDRYMSHQRLGAIRLSSILKPRLSLATNLSTGEDSERRMMSLSTRTPRSSNEVQYRPHLAT